MSQGNNGDARKRMLKDAKRVCCEMVQIKEFGFITKEQLALCVRNLVFEYNKLKAENDLLKDGLKSIKPKEEVAK